MIGRTIKMMLICCLSIWGGSLSAFSQDEVFNPDNPDEPAVINYCRLTVSADPAEGAYVSGGGRYVVNGNTVYISTSARNTEDYTYTFLYWTQNGEKTSYSKDFWFTPQKGTYELVAHYEKAEVVFDPINPEEPSASNVKRQYRLNITNNIEGCCSFNIASGEKHEEQSRFYVCAYLNSGYEFDCWKLNGSIVSTSQGFYLTMPSENSTLEACVTEIPFDPENPMEPSGTNTNVDVSGRQVIDIGIGSNNTVVDKTRVVFNEQKTLSYDTGSDASKFISNDAAYQIYSYDSNNTKYSVNQRPAGDVPIGIIVRETGEVTLSALRLDCTVYLHDVLLDVYHDMAISSYTFESTAGTIDNRFTLTTTIQELIATEVGGIKDSDSKSEIWYDLYGRQLRTKPLKKGIYIINGRKVVVK